MSWFGRKAEIAGSPMIVYRAGEFRSNGEIHSSIANVRISKSETFLKYSRKFSNINPDYRDNVIVEEIVYGSVVQNYNNRESNVAASLSSTLQIFFRCVKCDSFPLFPNTIVGFRTAERHLRLYCNNCSENIVFTPIKYLKENFSQYENINFVLNKKETSFTSLLTDDDFTVYKNNTLTKVERPDMSLIRVGEKNDLRTSTVKQSFDLTNSAKTAQSSDKKALDEAYDDALKELNKSEDFAPVAPLFDSKTA